MSTQPILTLLRIYLFLAICSLAFSHPADENPDLTLPETTREFRQDRFGMFFRWGVYSTLGKGEAVWKDGDLTTADYERLATFFNPSSFDAKEWVSLAKTAGMKYIIFSAKNSDGLAMWDSRASSWNIMDSTPFKRDVVKELAEECHRQGLKFFVYYSPLDWHFNSLFGIREGDRRLTNLEDAETTRPTDYTEAHLTELLTNYGKINGVRIGLPPTNLDAVQRHQQYQQAINLVRKHHPAALIGSEYPGAPLPGEDYKTNSADGLNDSKVAPAADLEYTSIPLELSGTINNSRGFRLDDHQVKTTRDLVHMLIRAAGNDANLVLNVGPMPNGVIQPEFSERLKRVGMWMAKHGDSIYATRGGPMPPQAWGVMTHRGKRVYVHVLDPETSSIEVQIPSRLRSARYFLDESDVNYETSETTAILNLRPEQRGELERLVVLETRQYQ